jgi:hypothetical protein
LKYLGKNQCFVVWLALILSKAANQNDVVCENSKCNDFVLNKKYVLVVDIQ